MEVKYSPEKFFSAERKCHAYSNEKNWLGEIGVCNGTKEREPCSCGGYEWKCDFYTEVRERSRKKPTNTDLIRAASEDKLIEWYCRHRDCGTCDYGHDIDCTLRAWLQSKAEDDLWQS